MKGLHTEKHKTLLKGIEEDKKKMEAILCPRIRRLNILKMSVLPEVILFSVKTLPRYQ